MAKLESKDYDMHNFNELNYFLTIAKTNSFVQAGKLLGISSSALSHSMRSLETSLNLRLLNRTTRNVSLTEAGLQLYNQIAPLFSSINQEVDSLNDFLNTPSGLIKINAPELAAKKIIYPKLCELLRLNPKIHIEIHVDNSWADIVKHGFDIGCRLGEDVSQEMIAVQISKPLKMALVASPAYLSDKNPPQKIEDLLNHNLIGMKISAQHGTEMTWEFNIDGKKVNFTPTPQISISNDLRIKAALDGLGIGWFGHLAVEQEIADGRLIELLPDFSMTYEPFYLYYPSRKGHSNAFKLLIDALRYHN